MAIEVRTVGPDELGVAFGPIWHYFGRAVEEGDAERMGRILQPARVHAAFDEDKIVGGAGAYALELTVPGGGVVPTAGVMAVGVLPTHRRRGVLTALMQQQLEAAHERGEPLGLLYASEGAIYGRFGFGLATLMGAIRLDRAHAGLVDGDESVGRTRLVERDEALELFPQVYDRVRERTPGMFKRTPDWWEVRRLAAPRWFPGGEVFSVVLELDGHPEAYAIYRVGFAVEDGATASTLTITEAIGATPAAEREIWRFLISIDWYKTLEAEFQPLEHPLFLQLAEPRRLRFTLNEGLWTRVIDVEAALAARSFAGEGEIVLEVTDALCAWNAGRWRVSAAGVDRTDAEPDVRLGIRELGSVYLGGFTFAQLARAVRIEELRDGAVARADELFRTDPPPWCPELF